MSWSSLISLQAAKLAAAGELNSQLWPCSAFLQLLHSNRRFALMHGPAEVLSHVLEASDYRRHLQVRNVHGK